jgi:hypothetical protein
MSTIAVSRENFGRHMIRFSLIFLLLALTAGAQTPVPADTSRAWLKLEIETSYGWFWQKSVGHAYLLTDPEHPRPLKAGKLCARLVAHDTTVVCHENADTLIITEHKKGIFIGKREAFLSAWCENPNVKIERVNMKP